MDNFVCDVLSEKYPVLNKAPTVKQIEKVVEIQVTISDTFDKSAKDYRLWRVLAFNRSFHNKLKTAGESMMLYILRHAVTQHTPSGRLTRLYTPAWVILHENGVYEIIVSCADTFVLLVICAKQRNAKTSFTKKVSYCCKNITK